MKTPEALSSLLVELEALEIDSSTYFSDLEPQGWVDGHLAAKVYALRAFCVQYGWSDLLSRIDGFMPLGGNALAAMETLRCVVIPIFRERLVAEDQVDWFWRLIHPKIAELARPRFKSEHFGDAVEASFKEINHVVKEQYRAIRGEEKDGAPLMTAAFSKDRPVLRLADDLGTTTGQNIQLGYMQIFSGAMTGIRNPKAHENLNPSRDRAMHLVCLASLLMHQVDESKGRELT